MLLQEKSKLRKAENIFVIDGWKETQMAIVNGFEVETIFCLDDFLPILNKTLSEQSLTQWTLRNIPQSPFQETLLGNTKAQKTPEIISVSDAVFDKISYRGNTSKVVAIAKQKQLNLIDIKPNDNPIFLVLDGIEKPGNLGAILRIADAVNITAVICCDTQTDIYNPNVIRSSVGCLFTQQITVCTKEECFAFLQENKVAIYTTSLKASKNYLENDYKEATAFIFGTEATGVDEFWETHSTQNIIIPMRGQNDSLNVSNSVAIVLFEALRQRNQNLHITN